jgi:hypothetical protein
MLLCHLLACHSELIRIVKVRFPDQTQVQFGVLASQDLAEGLCIPELCGVLSSDIVDGEHLSVMEAHSTQLLRKGPRLMTGPARFVNHSCNPNASVSINPGRRTMKLTLPLQLYPVQGTYTVIIRLLRSVAANEEITVRYGDMDNCLCRSCARVESEYQEFPRLPQPPGFE